MGSRVVGLVLLGLVLVGCAGGAPEAGPVKGSVSPSPSVSVSASPSSSTRPSPSMSALPKPRTAREFIRQWPIVENRMFVTGDTTAYRAMTRGCKPCAKLADQIEGYYANGGWVKTDPWSVVSIKPMRMGKRTQTYLVDTDIGPADLKRSSAGKVVHIPGGRPLLAPTLKRQGGSWLLIYYVQISR